MFPSAEVDYRFNEARGDQCAFKGTVYLLFCAPLQSWHLVCLAQSANVSQSEIDFGLCVFLPTGAWSMALFLKLQRECFLSCPLFSCCKCNFDLIGGQHLTFQGLIVQKPTNKKVIGVSIMQHFWV